MKWGGIAVESAVLALAVGAFVFALTTRVGARGTPTIAPANTPAVFATVVSPTVTATPLPTVKPASATGGA
jgi:hypothetical protein